MLKKSIVPVSIIVLSLVGLLASFILAEEFYYTGLPPVEGQPNPAIFTTLSNQVCGGADTFFSCETVSKSKYALFLGYPVALYGILFYVMTGLLALGLLRTSGNTRIAAILLFCFAALAFLVDIGLLAITLFVIGALCPFCLLTYIVNILILAASFFYLRKTGQPLAMTDFQVGLSRLAGYAVAVCLILSAAVGTAFGTKAFLTARRDGYIETFKAEEIQRSVDRFYNQSRVTIDVTPLYVTGPDDAPVTIIEVSDFLCPYCARAFSVLEKLAAANPDTVKVLFVNLPLDQTCNRFMQRRMHKGSCTLARGAVCASGQGKLYAYQKAAFKTRKKDPSLDDIKALAASAALSTPDFMQCMERRSTLAAVKTHIEEAMTAGIQGTPTIFINNKQFRGQLFMESLQQIVDMEAAQQKLKIQ